VLKPLDPASLEGEARTAAEYLIRKGLTPVKFLADRSKTYKATWKLLSEDNALELYNAFCDNKIQELLENRNYGDADAQDGEIMRLRYQNGYLSFMQKLMATGYNNVGSHVACGV
jgi:hypothetical protein